MFAPWHVNEAERKSMQKSANNTGIIECLHNWRGILSRHRAKEGAFAFRLTAVERLASSFQGFNENASRAWHGIGVTKGISIFYQDRQSGRRRLRPPDPVLVYSRARLDFFPLFETGQGLKRRRHVRKSIVTIHSVIPSHPRHTGVNSLPQDSEVQHMPPTLTIFPKSRLFELLAGSPRVLLAADDDGLLHPPL